MITCAQIQRALSSRMDHEQYDVADDVLDAHVAGCPNCQAFLEQAAVLNRKLRLQDTEQESFPVPPADLTQQIMSGLQPDLQRQAARRQLGLGVSRVLLGLAAVMYATWGLRLLGDVLVDLPPELDATAIVNATMDGVTTRFALAAGLLFALWRPQHAGSLAPVYGAIFAFHAGFATRSLVLGTATLSGALGLAVMLLAALALAATWVIEHGVQRLEDMWQELGSRPLKS